MGFRGFWFDVLEVVGLVVGGLVGGASVLSGVVTVWVLVLRGGETKPNWAVTGMAVTSGGVEAVGFTVWEEATYLTAEAAAATLRARLNPVVFLGVTGPPRFGVAAVAVMFLSRGKMGSRGGRLGL